MSEKLTTLVKKGVKYVKSSGLFDRLISEGKIVVHASSGGKAPLILNINTGLR
jgi:hypothetical protein